MLVRYDTRLTPKGEKQARSLNSRVKELSPAPEVLLASPLTRALSTSEMAFEGVDIPRVSREPCLHLGWTTEEALHSETRRKLLHAAHSVTIPAPAVLPQTLGGAPNGFPNRRNFKCCLCLAPSHNF